MHLRELVTRYAAARNAERPLGKELAPGTIRHLYESAAAYSKWLGREARIGDLIDESINHFLAHLLSIGRRPYGVKNRRTGLLVLMRFARRKGLTDAIPDGVRRVHCPELSIDGFAIDDMQALIEHAQTMGGTIRYTGLVRSVFWESFLRVKWELALRIGDMIRFQVADYKPGWLWVLEHKTGKQGWRELTPRTAACLERCIALKPQRELIWEGYAPQGAYKAFTRLAKRAKRPGTSKFVRRGAASELEARTPGAAWRLLRRSVPTLFEKHYRVGRICDKNPLRPPPLG